MSLARSGQRRSFITIEQSVDEKQHNGSIQKTWQTFTQVWAMIETLKGQDKVSAVAAYPSADQKITFRYIDGILPTMRVTFKNKIYSIYNVNNINEQNRELVLTTNCGVKAQ